MTTTAIMRGSELSMTVLMNTLYDIDRYGSMADEEIEDAADKIVTEVNSLLPGTLEWFPYTSEMWADTTDETEITAEDFKNILNDTIGKIMFE